MGEKKTLFILLIILAIVAVVGALYFFNVLKTPESSTFNIVDDIKYTEIYRIKETAVSNIINFVKTDTYPNSVFEDFYNNNQYKSLTELIIEINVAADVPPFLFLPSSASAILSSSRNLISSDITYFLLCIMTIMLCIVGDNEIKSSIDQNEKELISNYAIHKLVHERKNFVLQILV